MTGELDTMEKAIAELSLIQDKIESGSGQVGDAAKFAQAELKYFEVMAQQKDLNETDRTYYRQRSWGAGMSIGHLKDKPDYESGIAHRMYQDYRNTIEQIRLSRGSDMTVKDLQQRADAWKGFHAKVSDGKPIVFGGYPGGPANNS